MSLFLPSTKYVNTTRRLNTGTTQVEDSDLILDCDSSTGPITVNLKKIPADQWSTLYKLYVKDYGQKADSDNITIVAPTGYKINGASSVVINTPRAAALIRIVSDTDYVCTIAAISSGITALTVTDTSTVDLTLTAITGGYNLLAKVKLTDYMLAELLLSNPATNYFPKTPIYDGAGAILSSYFSDLTYAQTLVNAQAIKAYNNNTFLGAFTSGDLNLTNGEVTLPTSGVYLVSLRVRIALTVAATGPNSILSSNPATSGLPWNANTSLNKNCLFRAGIYDYQYGGVGCSVEKSLTDCGNFEIVTSMIRTYSATSKLRALFINNSDLDIYGISPVTSDVQMLVVKISEV